MVYKVFSKMWKNNSFFDLKISLDLYNNYVWQKLNLIIIRINGFNGFNGFNGLIGQSDGLNGLAGQTDGLNGLAGQTD